MPRNALAPLANSIVSFASSVAATWDGATKRLYVDGVLGAETSTVAITGGELLSIGADLDTGTPTLYFDGEIDALRIYPRVLTAAEIATLAR